MSNEPLNDARIAATFTAAGCDPAQAMRVLDGEPGALSAERSLALLTVDADSVQRTLLASPRPVTIYGASTALAEWDRRLRQLESQLVPQEAAVLFAGGGHAVLLVPQTLAPSLAERLEVAFAERMKARATAAFIEVSPKELVDGPRAHLGKAEDLEKLGLRNEGGGFGACMVKLTMELRARKLSARAHPYIDEPTDVARCEETGDRPRANGKTRSEFALTHRESGARAKADWKQAQTLDDVLKASGARRLAFVCIDGAGIGTRLASLGSVREYADFSRRLDDAFASLWSPRELGVDEAEHQIVLAGGDDLMLVLPAEGRGERPDALALTAKLVHRVERAFDGTAWPIGVGAGVLITSGVPARFAFEYARSLCDSAKTRIGGNARSGVDFEVVAAGSPLSSSLAEIRQQRENPTLSYPKLGQHGRLIPTRRPYTLEDFDELLRAAERLHQSRIGQSTISALLRSLEGDLNTAMIDIHYQLARNHRLRDALGVERLDPEGSGPWILERINAEANTYATGLGDLAEVLKLKRR